MSNKYKNISSIFTVFFNGIDAYGDLCTFGFNLPFGCISLYFSVVTLNANRYSVYTFPVLSLTFCSSVYNSF